MNVVEFSLFVEYPVQRLAADYQKLTPTKESLE
jgi:hypothetical protein